MNQRLMKYSEEQLRTILRQVRHPEKGKDLFELGIIKNIFIRGNRAEVILDFKKNRDPLAGSIRKACEKALRSVLGDDADLNIIIATQDSEAQNTTQEKNTILPGVRNIVAVASGKGGVGKSTVAVNLAVAMSKKGLSVGLLDADVYGPSIPKMFDLEGETPVFRREEEKDLIVPVEKHGVRILSTGFFVSAKDALVWRGPMATSAIRPLITQGDWGDLDILFIDLPPGTGDIHLTLVQEVPVTGVVIVSTPQQVAIADAIKGIAMFRGDKINVPVLGLVENMAWFTPAEYPENKYYIFGREGCRTLAEKMDIELLGQIPIVQAVCEDGDSGRPSVLDENNPAGKAFTELADKLADALKRRNNFIEPTKRVIISDTNKNNH